MVRTVQTARKSVTGRISPTRDLPSVHVDQENADKKPSKKLRGLPQDSSKVRVSKTLAWILRHGAPEEKLAIRPDGYVRVADLLANPRLQSASVNMAYLQDIVKTDSRQRYEIVLEPEDAAAANQTWWVRARLGHTIKTVKVKRQRIKSISDVSSATAVYGTDIKSWESISKEGLSKRKRTYIYLVQDPGALTVSPQILIHIDLQSALDEGIKFYLTDNGIIFTKGDKSGILQTKFFKRVEDLSRVALPVWEDGRSLLEIKPLE